MNTPRNPKGPSSPGPRQPVKPISTKVEEIIDSGIDRISGVIRRHPIVTAAAGLFLSLGAPQLSETVREAEKDAPAKISRSIMDYLDETRVSFNIWQKDQEFFKNQIAYILRELERRKEYSTLAEYYEDNHDDNNAKKYFKLAADKALALNDFYTAADYYEKANEHELAKTYWLRIAEASSSDGRHENAAEYYGKAEEFEKARKAWEKYAEDLFQKGDWRMSDYYKNTVVQAYINAGLTTDQIESKFAEQNKLEEQKDEAEIEILTKIDPNNLKAEDYIKIAQFYDRQDKKKIAQTYWLKAAGKYLETRPLPEAWEFELRQLYENAGLDGNDINLRFAQTYESWNSWANAALKYSCCNDMENAKRCWLKEAEKAAKLKFFDKAAEAYSNGGDKEKANKYFLLAAKEAEQYRIYQAAEFYNKGGDPNKAKKLFQQVAEKAYKEMNFSLAARAYSQLKNHGKSKECLIKVAQQTIAETTWNDGKERTLSDRISNAEKTLKSAGMDEKEINRILAETLEYYQYYQEAARYHEDENRKKECLRMRGHQLASNGEYYRAAEAYDKAEAAESKKSMFVEAAEKELASGDYEMAERYYRSTELHLDKTNLDKLIAAAEAKDDFAAMARFYHDKGEDEKAKEFYLLAAEIAESKGYWRDNSFSYEQAAKYYEKAGKDEDAKRCSILALELDMVIRGLMDSEFAEYCRLTGKTEKEAKLMAIKARAEYSAKNGWRYEQPWYFAKKAEELDDHETALSFWQLEFERFIQQDARSDEMNDRLDEEDSDWNLREKLNIFTDISRAISALERASGQQLTVIFPPQHLEQPPQHQL